MMLPSWLQRPLLVLFAVVCGVLLFLGGPDLVSTRSFTRAWDLGHIAAFAVWSLLLLRSWPWLTAARFGTQILVIVLLTLTVGGTAEIIQGTFGRYPSWNDLGMDVLGSLLALFFLFPKRHCMPRPWHRLFQAITIGLLLIALLPLTRALVDEWAMRRQFPVLADFETPFELDHWTGTGKAGIAIDHAIASSGRASLRIDLNTAQYSGAALYDFPGDWRGWAWIAFSIFNPNREPIRLTCKINDHQHDIAGYRYEDRFNRAYVIASGWHRIRIALADVADAPAGRKMDLSQITEFNLFAVRLAHPRTISLDRVSLENGPPPP